MKHYSCFDICHSDWKDILVQAMGTMNKDYLHQLMSEPNWLPGAERLFAAFSLPLAKTEYILLGESPYPRPASANGYAFWDNAVEGLWSLKGLSTAVNRATSLRNWIKMMLVARGNLDATNTSQEAIAKLNKQTLVQTCEQLFLGMMERGILLLNASLVYSEGMVPYHARQWKPFMHSLFAQLALVKSNVKLILLGKIAETISQDKLAVGLVAEHPYNISFITNQKVIEFFKPLDLLSYE
ncbi:uracil DNA glycosylase [Legionella drancourtii LLAP12]|uniref:Uracil DNA glycosylase n=2 Tax=Legionella drancourtii TaxID=168933 RepID=G9EUM0_9GAMM|nr:uracil DNA glycosylase [Legionella drancourtii LLAP12]